MRALRAPAPRLDMVPLVRDKLAPLKPNRSLLVSPSSSLRHSRNIHATCLAFACRILLPASRPSVVALHNTMNVYTRLFWPASAVNAIRAPRTCCRGEDAACQLKAAMQSGAPLRSERAAACNGRACSAIMGSRIISGRACCHCSAIHSRAVGVTILRALGTDAAM